MADQTPAAVVAGAIGLIGATELADRLGVARRSVYYWADGRREVPAGVPAEIAAVARDVRDRAGAILRAIDSLGKEAHPDG